MNLIQEYIIDRALKIVAEIEIDIDHLVPDNIVQIKILNILIVKILYFFKDRSTVEAFTEEQAKYMKEDIASIKHCFTSVLKRYLYLCIMFVLTIPTHDANTQNLS